MANQIDMVASENILRLHGQGVSNRRIARLLQLDRGTVARCIRLRADPKAAGVPAGIGDGGESKPAGVPAGIGDGGESKPARVPAGISASRCAPYHDQIVRGVEAGLTAQRIFQDLRGDHGFGGAYDTVKRYVRHLTAGGGRSVARMECAPGEEAQVDFGLGAPILGADGRRRRSWVFRLVLSHSRRGYSEAVFRQDAESFIRCIENAFLSFGGVARRLVLDNLRAAVKRADWHDPELSPKFAAFCRHCGTVAVPTRPRHPEHKGKVERGIGYVKGNALKGRVFDSLAAENAFLRWWERNVADERLHGTTRLHVGRCFEERERHALLPLPAMLFPSFEEARRTVHRDGCIEVRQAYYRVPDEHVGREVWARWDGRTVRVFDGRMRQIALHARLEPGQFSPDRLAGASVAETADYWCRRAGRIGPQTGDWARRVHAERGPESIRVLMGLWHLGRRAGGPAMEQACRQALASGAPLRLRDLRRRLEGRAGPVQMTFLESHPLIRGMDVYGSLVDAAANPRELPTTAPAGFQGPSGAAIDNSSARARAGAAFPTPRNLETP